MKLRFLLILICLSNLLRAQPGDIIPSKANQGVFLINIIPSENHKSYGFKTQMYRKILKHQSVGTGFLFNYKGKPYIISCVHVVESATAQAGAITALDNSGNKHTLEILGGDTFYDIVVLKFVEERPNLVHFSGFDFIESSPRQHQDVHVYGYAHKGQTLLSPKATVAGTAYNSLNEVNRFGNMFAYLALDKKMEKGMSGGPILSEEDKIIGVTALNLGIEEDVQYTYGLNGHIAGMIVKQILENKDHRIHRAFTGIVFQQISSNTNNQPVIINSVLSGFPATSVLSDKINAKILHINDQKIRRLSDIHKVMEFVRPGETVKITIKHNGKNEMHDIKTGELDAMTFEKIAKHYFKINPDYDLTIFNSSMLISPKGHSENNCQSFPFCEHTYEVNLAGSINPNGQQKRYYVADNMIRLGVITRLFSEFGHVDIRSIDHNKDKLPIRVSPATLKEHLSKTFVRLVYY